MERFKAPLQISARPFFLAIPKDINAIATFVRYNFSKGRFSGNGLLETVPMNLLLVHLDEPFRKSYHPVIAGLSPERENSPTESEPGG